MRNLCRSVHVTHGSCVGARYEHCCTTSPASSTRHTRGGEQSNRRAKQQLGGFWQLSAGSGQSSCRLGILFGVKPHRFVNNANGYRVIVDERKSKFS
jgi:hypothetical protein